MKALPRIVATICVGGDGSCEGGSGVLEEAGVGNAVRLLIVSLAEGAFGLTRRAAWAFCVGCRRRLALLGGGVVDMRAVCLVRDCWNCDESNWFEDVTVGLAMRAIS